MQKLTATYATHRHLWRICGSANATNATPRFTGVANVARPKEANGTEPGNLQFSASSSNAQFSTQRVNPMTEQELDEILAGWHADPAQHLGVDAHIRRLGEPHRSVIGMHARGLAVGATVFRSGRQAGKASVAVARALLLTAINAPRVGLSESGNRAGETHHRAKLTDEDVDQVFELHEAGLGYRRIAQKMDHIPGGISRSTVRDVIKMRRRCALVVGFKKA